MGAHVFGCCVSCKWLNFEWSISLPLPLSVFQSVFQSVSLPLSVSRGTISTSQLLRRDQSAIKALLLRVFLFPSPAAQ